MATIKRSPEKGMPKVTLCVDAEGLPNPIAAIQRQGNDRAQAIGGQAGGFCLNRR